MTNKPGEKTSTCPCGLLCSLGLIVRRILLSREMVIFALVLLLAVIMTATTPHFATLGNFRAMTINLAPEALIAIAMSYLIISGGFDLSVGSVMGLTGVVTAWLLTCQVPIPVAVAAGLGTGAGVGLLNGWMITWVGVNPLIATLATMWMARGLALAMTQGYPLANLPDAFGGLGQDYVFGAIPLPVVIMIIAMVAGDLAARHTRVVRQIYFVGGNEKAARFSGIRVDRVRLVAYTFSGLTAAFAGLILTSRLLSATPLAGTGVELRVISAVIIGGASLAGGEGTVIGTFLGMIFMSLVANALTMFNVSPYWHQVVTGAILALAVSADVLVRRRRGGRR